MSLLPKSKTARRRLLVVGAAAPVLAVAVGLALYAMKDAVVYFYTPSQAAAAHVATGKVVRLGGLVERGSVVKETGGAVRFVIADKAGTAAVVFHGDLPDLFREGQGVVAQGAYDASGAFAATEVLAKHDERYMPREVADALKKSGEWRGQGSKAP